MAVSGTTYRLHDYELAWFPDEKEWNDHGPVSWRASLGQKDAPSAPKNKLTPLVVTDAKWPAKFDEAFRRGSCHWIYSLFYCLRLLSCGLSVSDCRCAENSPIAWNGKTGWGGDCQIQSSAAVAITVNTPFPILLNSIEITIRWRAHFHVAGVWTDDCIATGFRMWAVDALVATGAMVAATRHSWVSSPSVCGWKTHADEKGCFAVPEYRAEGSQKTYRGLLDMMLGHRQRRTWDPPPAEPARMTEAQEAYDHMLDVDDPPFDVVRHGYPTRTRHGIRIIGGRPSRSVGRSVVTSNCKQTSSA